MRRIIKFLTSRMVWVAMVIVLQVAWMVLLDCTDLSLSGRPGAGDLYCPSME